MADQDPPSTNSLLQRAHSGDASAIDQLLLRHRQRLRRMVELRMDPRLATRLDPSDIVQETLADAIRRFDTYLQQCPVPFYPWLRQLAWNRMIDLYRRHVLAQRRSVRREERVDMMLSDHSALQLAQKLAHRAASPSCRVDQDEQKSQILAALNLLPSHYREVLVLRHLEQLSPHEIAAVLNITEGAVKTRTVRALQRMRELLTRQGPHHD